MKKIKTIIIVLIILIIIVLLIFLLKGEKKVYYNEYEKIVEKLNNKESFYVLLMQDENDELLSPSLDYYSDVYDLKYMKIKMNFNNNTFNKLNQNDMFGLTINDKNAFIVVKDGKVINKLVGEFGEKTLKRFLIDSNLISNEYKYVDILLTSDKEFDKYYKSDKTYCLLYINSDNNNLNNYRKKLVKNKIDSLVLYNSGISLEKTIDYFNKELKIKKRSNEKLPAVFKIKNNKIEELHHNITLDKLIDYCK